MGTRTLGEFNSLCILISENLSSRNGTAVDGLVNVVKECWSARRMITRWVSMLRDSIAVFLF